MGQLHELLAVEGDLKRAAEQEVKRIAALFVQGISRFQGLIKTYKPFEEGGESFPDEIVPRATSVQEELEELKAVFGKWIDSNVQKESTNQIAIADLVVDGKTLFTEVPATALLNLESKLTILRNLLQATPVLDPAKVWEWDENKGAFLAAPEVRYRTQKKLRSKEVSPATVKHAAQVETWREDVRIGEWKTVIESGMLTIVEKKALLDRLTRLLEATKKARQRANKAEVETGKMADVLFEYIYT